MENGWSSRAIISVTLFVIDLAFALSLANVLLWSCTCCTGLLTVAAAAVFLFAFWLMLAALASCHCLWTSGWRFFRWHIKFVVLNDLTWHPPLITSTLQVLHTAFRLSSFDTVKNDHTTDIFSHLQFNTAVLSLTHAQTNTTWPPLLLPLPMILSNCEVGAVISVEGDNLSTKIGNI